MIRWLLCACFVMLLLTGMAPPAQTRTFTRLAYYDPRDPRSWASLQTNHRYLDIVSPTYWRILPNGDVVTSDQPDAVAKMRSWGLRVMPMVQKYAWSDKMHGWIANPTLRARTADQLAALIHNGGYDGINVDIEHINDDDGGYLTAFLDQLADRIRPAGKAITVAIPARTAANERWHRAFDYAAIGQRADLVIVMAYDHGYAAGQPAPVAPLPWVREVVAYTQTHIPNNKILLGIPFYGYDWNTSRRGWARYVGVDEIVGRVGERGYDPAAAAPWLRYTAGREQHMVWYENWQSVQSKWDLVVQSDVQGWAAWRLGYEDPAVWTLIGPRR
jgi:spore germination protein